MKNIFIFMLSVGLIFSFHMAEASTLKCAQIFNGVSSTLKVTTKKERVTQKKEEDALVASTKREATQRVYTLEDFFDSNPKTNFAIVNPSTVISAAQKYVRYILKEAPRVVKDPVYKSRNIKIYPAFVGELPESSGRLIIGQYDAIEEVVSYIRALATGRREGKVPLLLGPAGTGKTEMLMILDNIRANLAGKDPQFTEYTFEWTHIDQIPALRPLLPSRGDQLIVDSLRDDLESSPFVLLRDDMRSEVVANLQSNRVLDSMTIIPWEGRPANAERIMEEIFKYYIPEFREGAITLDDLSKEEYLDILQKHVRIVKRNFSSRTANVIRHQPENPNYQLLFSSENIVRKMFYRTDDPLQFDYTGKVLKLNGGAIALDEFFRNDPNLVNIFLEVFQNGVLETDAGPAVKLDSVVVLTSNDESLDKARQDGSMNALVDRMTVTPMRWNIHPQENSKLGLVLYGLENFYIRNLNPNERAGETGKIVPLYSYDSQTKTVRNRLNELYPLPDENGNMPGADGRYAVYYKNGEQMILIAPHTLEMFGLVLSATRLEVDAKKMAPFWGELNVASANSQYYTNVTSRLELILGRASVETAVRQDLEKARELVEEGRNGISARDSQLWIQRAIEMAIDQGDGVLTPYTLDRAFDTLMSQKKFRSITDKTRAEILSRYQIVKRDFVLKDLTNDINIIVSGDGERAERIYDTIEKEIIALSQNPEALEFYPDDNSAPQPINRSRLSEISKVFKDKYNREFNAGFLLRHLGSVQGSRERVRNKELLGAITQYLTQVETNITESTARIAEYYEGKSKDPKVEKEVREAESRLSSYGYDRISFVQAISFWSQLKYEASTIEKKAKD